MSKKELEDTPTSREEIIRCQEDITFDRVWSMPTKNTFEIDAIHDLIVFEISQSEGIWIDPFSGGTSYADITNDLNPDINSDKTLKAIEFLRQFDDNEVDGGVLFDPPYSARQVAECYDYIGFDVTKQMTQTTFWSNLKNEIERICASGSTVISCSWNSNGIGKGNGFKKEHILIVAHGAWHNDTIVTVEKRVVSNLSEYDSTPSKS